MEPWLENFARANFRRSADTAHDLKTPLNVAVLNLELLRMRLQKLTAGADDEKLAGYTRAIDTELRRMGQIFDSFFLLSTPPRDAGEPSAVDLQAVATEAAETTGISFAAVEPGVAIAHELRIRQAFTLFFDGAARACTRDCAATTGREGEWYVVTVEGKPNDEQLEPSKVFKFYYTDQAGNPDLSLASARVIAETYGGEVSASQESGRIRLSMRLPLGGR